MANAKRPVWDASDCALILIDYQHEMFSAVRSSDPKLIEANVCFLARAAKAFGIPVVLSTVGVKMGVNKATIETLRKEIPDVPEIDRSSMDAWEDAAFLSAVKGTDRRRLVMCGLWTEICLAFPAVEALASGYEVCFVADAVGGESKIEHEVAISRLTHAGAIPNTTTAMVAEWFRDWKAPLADTFREIWVPYLHEKAAIIRASSATG